MVLLPDYKGTELEPFIRYSISLAELRLKMLHEALEGFLDLADAWPGSVYARWALEQAAEIYERDGNRKKADECFARALGLYKKEKEGRRVAGALTGLRSQEMKALFKERKAGRGLKLLERTRAEVPLFLLGKEEKKMLEEMGKLQAQAGKIKQAKTYQLQVSKMAAVKEISQEEFPGYKKDSAYLVYSPDKSKYVCREMAKNGFFYLYLGEKGKDRRRLRNTRNALYPAWDRNGKRVLFTRRHKKTDDYKIEAVAVQSGKIQELYIMGRDLGYRLACCKLSGKIAFTYAGDVWLMEGNGMDVRKLTNGLRLSRGAELGWSVDGSRIFYAGGKKGGAAAKKGVIQLDAAG